MDINENNIDLKSRCKAISGKSGAFFYFTLDKRFLLKSVSQEELDVLLTMIKDYTKRITSAAPSFLTNIFGIFKIWIGPAIPIILILCENLAKQLYSPLIFDLKGSTHERKSTTTAYESIRSMPRNKIYKDLDFSGAIGSLQLVAENAKNILLSLALDTELLKSYEIMDYSMLVLIEEAEEKYENCMESYRYFKFKEYNICIGIIDYLQTYSVRKKLETKINTLKADEAENYSCIPPVSYRKRFLSMARYTLGANNLI